MMDETAPAVVTSQNRSHQQRFIFAEIKGLSLESLVLSLNEFIWLCRLLMATGTYVLFFSSKCE
jgi:hypothetical protein